MSLESSTLRSALARGDDLATPVLVYDLARLQDNYHRLREQLPEAAVRYAMKANDEPRVLSALIELGCGFEIASQSELERLLALGVDPEQIICINSIKPPAFLKALDEHGVRILAFDSSDEIAKIAKHAPDSELVLRVIVDNIECDWPLTAKFGVAREQALELMEQARDAGLRVAGLTFHVGSQCRNSDSWRRALLVCRDIWVAAAERGIELDYLSLGGGLAAQHTKPIPTLHEVTTVIRETLSELADAGMTPSRLTIEPGRGLVADAADMITRVIGTAMRGEQQWAYLDVGVFNGLMESIQGFSYRVYGPPGRPRTRMTVAGPSCDSVDIPFPDLEIEQLETGDLVVIEHAGAYTSVYAAAFNGFPIPSPVFP